MLKPGSVSPRWICRCSSRAAARRHVQALHMESNHIYKPRMHTDQHECVTVRIRFSITSTAPLSTSTVSLSTQAQIMSCGATAC